MTASKPEWIIDESNPNYQNLKTHPPEWGERIGDERIERGRNRQREEQRQQQKGDDWEGWPSVPGALPSATFPVPPMPPDLVPEPLRPWVTDAAERVSVPIEYIAAPAIVAAGALVGRTVGILPRRHDDWLVVPNLWGAVVGPPGVLKSAAVAEGMRWLNRLAAQASQTFKELSATAEARQAVVRMQVEQVKRRGQRKAAFDIAKAQADMETLYRQIAEAMPVERRYVTQDATVEKLGELLRENSRGILLLRDELAGFFANLDKPGREGERAFFLEGWNGTGAFNFDRIGRGNVHVPAVCLSLLGGIQPSKLAAHVEGALAHGDLDDGLLQRVQLLVWPDSLAEWRNVDRWPDSDARSRAFSIFERLDRLDPAMIGAVTPEHADVPALRFVQAAQGLFDEWRTDLERELRGSALTSTASYAAHIAKYRSLLPALALLFDLVDRVEGHGAIDGVSLAATELAISWVEYHRMHAKKLYAVELNPGARAARLLAEKIRSGDVGHGDTVRDVGRNGWAMLDTSARVRDAALLLERAGWCRIVKIKASGEQGGRKTELLRIHPKLRRTT